MRRTVATGLVVVLAACSGNTITQPSTPRSSGFITPSGLVRNFSVTFTANSGCTSLPQNVQRRTYSGTSDTSGPYTLGGAVFASWHDYGLMNVISLVMWGDTVEAWFQDGPIMEFVTPESALTIEGHAKGPISGSIIDLPINGSFVFCPRLNQAEGGCLVEPVSCRSTNHKLTLVPQ